MLFNAEGLSCLLHFHAQDDIEILRFFSCFLVILSSFVITRIVGVLHEVASMLTISRSFYALFRKSRSAIFERVVFTSEIHHRACLTFFIDDKKRRNSSRFGHFRVISTKGRRNVHDTRTIFRGDIVPRNHAERLISHFHKLVLSHRENTITVLSGIFAHKVSCRVGHLFRRTHPWHQLSVTHTD